LATHAQTRFEAALNQHDNWVTNVIVRLEDVNGPKGGVDKRCQATINLRAGASVVLEDISPDVYSAINTVADRAKQAVGRKVAKIREK
jgi:ribosome-associated translation inhibitor RaiA